MLSTLGEREHGAAGGGGRRHRDALKERTRERVSLDWATTPNCIWRSASIWSGSIAPPDALAEIGRAAEIDSDNARYAYVYAVALNSAGRTDDAIKTLEASYARHPAERDTLFALVTIIAMPGATPLHSLGLTVSLPSIPRPSPSSISSVRPPLQGDACRP
jgi:hypothetical protein